MKIFKNLFYFIIVFFTLNQLFAQDVVENWVPTDKIYGSKIYVDIEGLSQYSGDDFWVWALQENNPPLELDGIRREIYKTKTYYLINKELRKYSIAQVIYYDEDDNVITSFSYKINKAIPKFKYNYPIYPGADLDFIITKCLDYLGEPKTE